MSEDELYQAIFKRRSVRRYAGPLDQAEMDKVKAFTASLKPLYPELPVELRFMGSEDIKGLFKVSAPHFLGFFSAPGEGAGANAGFMLQQVDLFLSAIGIGCCWQGGPKPVAKEHGDKKFIIALAFGRPAEEVHRSVSGFKRRPLSEITALSGQDELLEPARLAPSAMNKQNWYFTGGDGVVRIHHGNSAVTGRMNEINGGIALCHIWLAARHQGRTVQLLREAEGNKESPRGHSYMASAIMS